jgi:hypothetical protein
VKQDGLKVAEFSMSAFFWPEMSPRIGVKMKFREFGERKYRSSVANTFILLLLLATCFGFYGKKH